jgi:hypothetical protein
MEFQVKIWKQLLLTWHKRTLIIRDTDFQIEKRVKGNISKEVKTYPLYSAVIVDQSKHNDLNILVGTSSYKVFIKPLSKEEKQKIISKLEERIKQFSSQITFSEDYLRYNEDLLSCFDNSPYGIIVRKLNMFQNLILEMAQKLDNFKTLIQNKHGNTTNYMSLHNNLMTIKEEMKKQFDEIVSSVYNYHDLIEGVDTSVLTKKNYKFNDNIHRESDLYSSEEENDINQNINIDDNMKKNEKRNSLKNEKSQEEKDKKVEEDKKSENKDNNEIKENNNILVKKDSKELKKNQYYFLSDNIEDFHDENYNFEKRNELPHKIICPKNIIKEMVTNMTKRLPSPVYFNEPISMSQKQCEKFKYMDLLIKAGKENNKEMQMCYIAAFLIGELFLNLGRTLKPFNPIIGETFEFFDNEKNFRYYAEQVKHNPQITAYIAETPEFAYYGDTLNTTSFKFFKGSIELLFKNKTHIHCKSTGDHYIFNPPNVYVKGLMKPPLYNDYAGTTIIQNTTDTSYRCELKFIEEGWTPDSLGNFEGTVFKDYETIVYLLKGNWKKEIYMTDPEGNNRVDLLKLDEDQEYIKNTPESYVIPQFSCQLNQITPELEKILPKNDSRFRLDIRNLEEKTETDEAQNYKLKYEEKQRKELNNDDHKILFFTEFLSPETEDKYYLPNGKYWEYRKEGKILENENCKIFDVEGY